MSEHQKQSAFLKDLVVLEDGDEQRQLRDRIQQAERDEKCIWRALRMMLFIALLSLAGLGHLAVLLPEFLANSNHVLVRVVTALALASGICLVGYLGYWLWHRALLNRAREECRRFILKNGLSTPVAGDRPESVPVSNGVLPWIETPNPVEEEARLIRLRKVS